MCIDTQLCFISYQPKVSVTHTILLGICPCCSRFQFHCNNEILLFYAAFNVDFTVGSMNVVTTITFTPLETQKCLNLTIFEDNNVEETESFSISLLGGGQFAFIQIFILDNLGKYCLILYKIRDINASHIFIMQHSLTSLLTGVSTSLMSLVQFNCV